VHDIFDILKTREHFGKKFHAIPFAQHNTVHLALFKVNNVNFASHHDHRQKMEKKIYAPLLATRHTLTN